MGEGAAPTRRRPRFRRDDDVDVFASPSREQLVGAEVAP